MNKLEKIASMCKADVTLSYRGLSGVYEKLSENLVIDADRDGEYYHVTNFLDGELEKCLDTDQYWCLQFYPHTPVGFYHAFSNDLEKLLDWAIDILDCEKK